MYLENILEVVEDVVVVMEVIGVDLEVFVDFFEWVIFCLFGVFLGWVIFFLLRVEEMGIDLVLLFLGYELEMVELFVVVVCEFLRGLKIYFLDIILFL